MGLHTRMLVYKISKVEVPFTTNVRMWVAEEAEEGACSNAKSQQDDHKDVLFACFIIHLQSCVWMICTIFRKISDSKIIRDSTAILRSANIGCR